MSYSKLILNIPHSSIVDYDAGWNGKYKMFPIVKKWTDWHTNLLFNNDDKKLNIKSCVFGYSRFFCDAERLINDPLEHVGQGIIYRKFCGLTREPSDELIYKAMSAYDAYHLNMANSVEENTCLVDCHSFPEELAKHVDVCIGFNEDNSKPSEEVLNTVTSIFTDNGYNVDWNSPYQNSVVPKAQLPCSSFMIEVNKKTYMDEKTLELYPTKFDFLHKIINHVYLYLLTGERHDSRATI